MSGRVQWGALHCLQSNDKIHIHIHPRPNCSEVQIQTRPPFSTLLASIRSHHASTSFPRRQPSLLFPHRQDRWLEDRKEEAVTAWGS